MESETMSPEEINAMRAELIATAAAELSKPAPTPKSTPAPRVPKVAAFGSGKVNPESIRQTVIRMLLAGSDTKAIAAVLREKFPTSAAAAKSVIHIAYYRAKLRKSGHLPKVGQVSN